MMKKKTEKMDPSDYTEVRAASVIEPRMIADGWRFDHEMGVWYQWDGLTGIWRPCRMAEALDYLRTHITAIIAEEETMDRDASRIGRLAFIRAVEILLAARPDIAAKREIWDASVRQAAAPGGHVRLTAGLVGPPERDAMCTRMMGALPVNKPAPRWEQFIRETTGGDEDFADYLQRVAGYCSTGLTTEQAFFFVFGSGGNGKSVFLDTLRSVLGDYAISVPAEMFEVSQFDRHPEELARLAGVRLVTASETRAGRGWNEVRIKQLTGDAAITARYMRQNTFEFTPRCKLIIAGNNKPTLRIVDDAIRRRMHVIPFTRKPLRPDPKLLSALQSELGGIAWWVLQGVKRWKAEGLRKPSVVQTLTDSYLADQDVIGAWLSEETDALSSEFTPNAEIHESYSAFCRALDERPLTQRTLSEQLEARGYPKARRADSRGHTGLRIRRSGSVSWGRQA